MCVGPMAHTPCACRKSGTGRHAIIHIARKIRLIIKNKSVYDQHWYCMTTVILLFQV